MGTAKFYARERFLFSLIPESGYLFYQNMAYSPYCLTNAQYLGKMRFYKNRRHWIKTYKRWTARKKHGV